MNILLIPGLLGIFHEYLNDKSAISFIQINRTIYQHHKHIFHYRVKQRLLLPSNALYPDLFKENKSTHALITTACIPTRLCIKPSSQIPLFIPKHVIDLEYENDESFNDNTHRYEFKCCDHIGILPSHVQRLSLHYKCPFPLLPLPTSLRVLKLRNLNHSLSVGTLPHGLQTLEVNDCEYPFLPNVLPSTLTFLNLGYPFSIGENVLPARLKTFQCSDYSTRYEIESLPPSLTEFFNNAPDLNMSIIPTSITYLCFYDDDVSVTVSDFTRFKALKKLQIHSINSETFFYLCGQLETLSIIEINIDALQPISDDHPVTLKTLTINNYAFPLETTNIFPRSLTDLNFSMLRKNLSGCLVFDAFPLKRLFLHNVESVSLPTCIEEMCIGNVNIDETTFRKCHKLTELMLYENMVNADITLPPKLQKLVVDRNDLCKLDPDLNILILDTFYRRTNSVTKLVPNQLFPWSITRLNLDGVTHFNQHVNLQHLNNLTHVRLHDDFLNASKIIHFPRFVTHLMLGIEDNVTFILKLPNCLVYLDVKLKFYSFTPISDQTNLPNARLDFAKFPSSLKMLSLDFGKTPTEWQLMSNSNEPIVGLQHALSDTQLNRLIIHQDPIIITQTHEFPPLPHIFHPVRSRYVFNTYVAEDWFQIKSPAFQQPFTLHGCHER